MNMKVKKFFASLLACVLVIGLCPQGVATISAKTTLSKTSAVHSYEGGSGSFTVYSDESWSYMVTYQIVTVKRVDNEIRYTLQRNDTSSYRKTSIMIMGNNGPVAEFFITQYPEDPSSVPTPPQATSVTLSKTTSNASYNKSTGSFTVTGNGTFQVNTNVSFIKAETAGNTVKYTVDANPNTSSRTGKINIVGYHGVMATFTITQAGKPVMPTVRLSSTGSGHPYYQTNGSFTVSCSAGWSSAVACGFVSASRNGNTINYTVYQNPTNQPRTGKILIVGQYGVMAEYTISQGPKPV